tara:strand:- start:9397 stop:9771 length:375 start_codon:yes stop_codon:yes gene_type:complete
MFSSSPTRTPRGAPDANPTPGGPFDATRRQLDKLTDELPLVLWAHVSSILERLQHETLELSRKEFIAGVKHGRWGVDEAAASAAQEVRVLNERLYLLEVRASQLEYKLSRAACGAPVDPPPPAI